MSLLSISQEVCDVIGLARPAAIVTGNDQLARQIFGLAKETLDELGLMDWPILQVPYSFTTVPNQTAYNLPTNFGREIGDTVFVASQYTQLRGSLTPADWQRQRDSLAQNIGRYRFRIYGLPTMLNFAPTPQVAEEVTFEYQTTIRVRQADNTYKNTYFADTDVSVVPEELVKKGLKWRLRRAKGLDYSEEFDDYEIARAQRLAQALGMGSMPVAYRSGHDMPEELNVWIPETGYGS
jgi:hypothetical protein